MKKYTAHGISLVLTLLAFSISPCVNAQTNRLSPAEAALAATAREGKYSFVLFWKQEDQATQSMRHHLQTALSRHPAQATIVLVQLTDPAEKSIVDRFGVSRSPMPLAIAVAPNGAITGGFPLKLSEAEVASAFVSPGMANCLKATQARKLVLLCVQPAGINELPAGVREFKADAQLGPVTEVVIVRGNDSAEGPFLAALKIRPSATTTITALLAPPGSMLGAFEGPADKRPLVEKLKSAGSGGCCPGGKCGPGGCCPK